MPDEYLMEGTAKLAEAREEGDPGKIAAVLSKIMAAGNCKGEEHTVTPLVKETLDELVQNCKLTQGQREGVEAALNGKLPLAEVIELMDKYGLKLPPEFLKDFFEPEIPAYRRPENYIKGSKPAEEVGALYAMIFMP